MVKTKEEEKNGHSDEFDDVYDDEDLEELEENDEITPEEEGFMHGYTKKRRKQLKPH